MNQAKAKRSILICFLMVVTFAIIMAGILMSKNRTLAESSTFDNQPAVSTSSQVFGDKIKSSGEKELNTNDTLMRWKGKKWEYSTDKGKTWTDKPPKGVRIGKNGGITIGNTKDKEVDALMKETDKMIDDILSDIDKRYGKPIQKDGGSFFSMGDKIARQVDGKWEFSSDNGKTWTKKPPKDVDMSKDGSRLRVGKNKGKNDSKLENWFKEHYNTWSDFFRDDDESTMPENEHTLDTI